MIQNLIKQTTLNNINSLNPVIQSISIKSSVFNNTDIIVFFCSTYGLNWASLNEVKQIGTFSNINVTAYNSMRIVLKQYY